MPRCALRRWRATWWIKDDCVPFDPNERAGVVNEDDPLKNMAISMVKKIAKEMTYQNLMGLNVLTIHL